MIGIGAELAVEIMRAVDAHGQREPHEAAVVHGQAEGLLIEEIAPAADGLGQHQPRRHAIHNAQYTYLFMAAVEPKAQ